MAILKKALISNAMFSDLDEEQINDICECMEDMSYKKSDVVFRLGESHPCNAMEEKSKPRPSLYPFSLL